MQRATQEGYAGAIKVPKPQTPKTLENQTLKTQNTDWFDLEFHADHDEYNIPALLRRKVEIIGSPKTLWPELRLNMKHFNLHNDPIIWLI